MIPHSAQSRGRSRGAISARSLLLLAVAALSCCGALWIYRQPIRAAAREVVVNHRLSGYRDVLEAASLESGVDVHLLAAIMASESSGRLSAVSSKGALGLFQLSLGTAQWRAELLGLEEPTREELLRNPLLNARLGADTMAWLLDTYDGNEMRALCAYNAGTGRLKQLTDAAGGWEAWRAKGEASGRSEILMYAKRVLRARDEYRTKRLFEPRPASATGARG